MDNVLKPRIETWEAALGEFIKNKKVETVRCEQCNELIEVTQFGYEGSGYFMNCKCGLYKDNLRGL